MEHRSGAITDPMDSPVIVWFREDLRLADHAALRAAVDTGQPILPLYILDDSDPWPPGGAARWWLHRSLASLALDVETRGGRLVLRRGSQVEIVPRLVAATGANQVFTGGMTAPTARSGDRAIAACLATRGVRFHRLRTATLFGPHQVKTKAGGPYGVYTPFARACLALPTPREPLPAPERFPCAPPCPSDRLEDWHLLPTCPDWAAGLRETWVPGETGARHRLDRFLAGPVADYAARRDIPASESTSMLSPHLRFGEISAARVFHAVRTRAAGEGANKFVAELLWREFSHHLLWNHTELPETPLRPAFDSMPWRDDPVGLEAWRRGRTGIPIVDAGMRQLWQTGWMHNRVRMIVASFLVKHLLVDWRQGQAWFWDTLVDADLANNAASWQWVAGCGADAAPFFRIFNPVLQGQKFDPDGAYVRRFVPELGSLDARHIHSPWTAPADALAEAGIALGSDYPWPVVDLAEGRKRALAAFHGLPSDRHD
jgi:deoxyribodipyrimidine photo-lyase